MIKPQITKEYINAQAIGRPDFSTLENNYEKREKYYEPQYSVIPNRKGRHQKSNRPIQCQDEEIDKADVAFRETETQILHQESVFQQIKKEASDDFYDTFM